MTRVPEDVAAEVYNQWWPPDLPPHVREAEIARTAFHLRCLQDRVPADGTVCDVGGGWGAFAAACALFGYRAILIDDFGDAGFIDRADRRFEMLRALDVRVSARDIIRDGLGLEAESIDALTSFDSIEHWHDSPRGALKEGVRALRAGGVFFLGAPNSVNIRKRFEILFGRGKWSEMSEWYDKPRFRSHVREPDVSDLRYIARDLGLQHVEVFGRNWQGLLQESPWIRGASKFAGPLLALRPTLCADIYLRARKPDSPPASA